MGKAVIEQLKKRHPDLPLYAIGTNSIATAAMLRRYRRTSLYRQCPGLRHHHRPHRHRLCRCPLRGDHPGCRHGHRLQQRLQDPDPRQPVQPLHRRMRGSRAGGIYPPGVRKSGLYAAVRRESISGPAASSFKQQAAAPEISGYGSLICVFIGVSVKNVSLIPRSPGRER